MIEQIREEIANVLEEWQPFVRHSLNTVDPCLIVNQILSIKGLRIEAENQDLPEVPDNLDAFSYLASQADMLKAGWVKCKVKEE